MRSVILQELTELERSCAQMQQALIARDELKLQRAFSDARRLTHALHNAMEAATAVRDEPFDREVTVRLQRVYEAREWQRAWLQGYHDAVGERLRTFSKWKLYARSVGGTARRRSRLGSLDDLR